jgi:hypothetical protein
MLKLSPTELGDISRDFLKLISPIAEAIPQRFRHLRRHMPVDGSLARPISAHGWPPRKPYFGRPDGAIGLLSRGE